MGFNNIRNVPGVDNTSVGVKEPVSLFAIAAVQILNIKVYKTEVEGTTIFRNVRDYLPNETV